MVTKLRTKIVVSFILSVLFIVTLTYFPWIIEYMFFTLFITSTIVTLWSLIESALDIMDFD